MSFCYDPVVADEKARNVAVYEETMRICRAGGYVVGGQFVALPPVNEVVSESKFYENPPTVYHVPTIPGSFTHIDAVNMDCVDVVCKLVYENRFPILLNMASGTTPGGGVLCGARAQEESLFRQSNLCVSLYQYSGCHADLLEVPKSVDRYPIPPCHGGIYSGRVTFFRLGHVDGDRLVKMPFECAVVSVPAINRPELDSSGRMVASAVETTKDKIRSMLRIALLHEHYSIVLGAWGCGAYRNPPEHMAELFDQVLHEVEFANKFVIVRFAVIEDHNSHHSNFAAFDRRFNG